MEFAERLWGQRQAANNQPGDEIQRTASHHPRERVDGSLTSVERTSSHPITEMVERSMALAHVRHFSMVKEELAKGDYKLASSDLAECLLKLAERDSQ